ncbi:MAG: glycine zipper 2TM domain-containing protein [Ramlibacter sp.]|uniref:glycine zipper 2TM domain-containing protein n=1 Tax=Ramlibacter sp. TaxID=1917967 RepID=UPI002613C860|nr:glycine zipper 2TM domain-containing protein [Ramlibacter sp.]MDH4377863.1 glycine zipper 2TM domain-containing protein [Ramlibacter sp.]
MRHFIPVPIVAAALLATGCANYPPMGGQSPATTVSTNSPSLVYGRVASIEYVPPGTQTSRNANIIGAVVGGVAGAALGHTIGGGSGRDVATVLGGVAGAAVGSQVGRNASGTTTTPSYRVSVQSDQGGVYTYEVATAGELRVGDRVQVENNVIHRR